VGGVGVSGYSDVGTRALAVRCPAIPPTYDSKFRSSCRCRSRVDSETAVPVGSRAAVVMFTEASRTSRPHLPLWSRYSNGGHSRLGTPERRGRAAQRCMRVPGEISRALGEPSGQPVSWGFGANMPKPLALVILLQPPVTPPAVQPDPRPPLSAGDRAHPVQNPAAELHAACGPRGDELRDMNGGFETILRSPEVTVGLGERHGCQHGLVLVDDDPGAASSDVGLPLREGWPPRPRVAPLVNPSRREPLFSLDTKAHECGFVGRRGRSQIGHVRPPSRRRVCSRRQPRP
jgi:hypothetical protein